MSMNRLNFLVVILAALQLGGCAAVAVTGVAAGAAVAADKRTTGTIIEDQAIELKASELIYADDELHDNTHINVTSYNTIVLVTGEAPTDQMRQRVIEIVRNIEKVSSVHNEITIAAPSSFMSRSSDSVITSKVKAQLATSRTASAMATKVVTEKGVVYLMGLVTRQQGERATEIARTTGGVQRVVRLFQYTD